MNINRWLARTMETVSHRHSIPFAEVTLLYCIYQYGNLKYPPKVSLTSRRNTKLPMKGSDCHQKRVSHSITKSTSFPKRPTVVVCVDGFDPTYLTHGIDSGTLPALSNFVSHGFHKTANVAMPTFTNPNNVSIITGQPTSVSWNLRQLFPG